jgi:hypothetical protein
MKPRLTAADFAGRTRASPAHAKRHVGQQNTRAVSDRPEGSESEFGRQIPVDLEADADLNEGWGCPGHWSSSLFPSDNKVNRGGPLRKPHTTREMHRRRLLSRGILLQPPRGTPGDMPSGVSLRRESHSMPGCSGHLANSLLRMGGLFVPLRGSSYGS